MKRLLIYSLTCLAALLLAIPAQAQYFGRNKPRYQKLDFKVQETDHFEIYEYLNNPEKMKELAAASELWYRMHQSVLRDTFTRRNPMIIYNDHAGFQQVNAIQGDVSVGTGGVTEALRNRVIFPVAMTNQQTHHVLGHELVHAFQYHMVLEGDSTNMRNLGNLPLWMVEGLAEYLSIGRVDAHTALWMRDAVIYNELPRKLRDLDRGKFFPYRWGQSFWAFVAGAYGDGVIRDLFMNTAKFGLEPAIGLTLGTTPDSLASAWTATLRQHYGRWVTPLVKDGKKDKDEKKAERDLLEKVPGKLLLSEKNAGRMNICPVLSPNGKYVIFLSEKNMFTMDLFLADAKTGKIIKKVSSTAQDGHIDQFNFIESAGAWSPDSKRFAFDVYQNGRSVLVIRDVLKGKTISKIKLDKVPAFSNPAWSPDGKTIVVSGLVNGQTDLYAIDVRSKKAKRLTNDKFSEILPAWSADGKQIVFSTDQLSMERGRINGAWQMNLAVMDYASGEVDHIDVFPGADNMNPHFDKTGKILFLSDRDGFRNLYQYDPATKKVYQMTNLMTGITGITPYAPALSVAEDRDRIVFTYYAKGDYNIYAARADEFVAEEADPYKVDMLPGVLPPFDPRQRDVVNTNLRIIDSNFKDAAAETAPKQQPYRPKFNLAYLGGGIGAGVMTGNTSFGNAVGGAGGVSALFDDILGNNQIFTGLSLNGQIQDAVGIASYINNKNRIGWGFNVSHIPFASFGGYQFSNQPVPVDIGGGQQAYFYEEVLQIDRLFNQRVGGLVFYPFSTTKRVEMSLSMDLYQQRSTLYRTYYQDPYGLYAVGQQQERGPRVFSEQMGNIGIAYVGDNSYSGLTASPLQGWRYRIGAEQYLGYWNFTALLADGRQYFRVKPFTLALRGIAYTRVGKEANSDKVFPLFAAQPFFVRGYNSSFLYEENPELARSISGSKLGVANAEIRIPFTGPKGIAVLPFDFLFTDLNLFVDAGLAFNDFSDLKKPEPGQQTRPEPLISAGVSLRVNVLGALILEPFYALPLSANKDTRRWVFGLNIVPGW